MSRLFVRMFKPQFAGLVMSGQKCQTIRPIPKRMPKSGDRIILRMWTGKPYRSPQRTLLETNVSKVHPVQILGNGGIILDGRLLTLDQEWTFAKHDGFNSPKDLFDWFNTEHGLPFDGIVIYWQNDKLRHG